MSILRLLLWHIHIFYWASRYRIATRGNCNGLTGYGSISSSTDCTAAAIVLNLQLHHATVSFVNLYKRPKGCYYVPSKNELYFNNHADGNADTDRHGVSICEIVPDGNSGEVYCAESSLFWVICVKFVVQTKNFKKIDKHFHVMMKKKFDVVVQKMRHVILHAVIIHVTFPHFFENWSFSKRHREAAFCHLKL